MACAAVVWEMLDAVGRLHKLPERNLDLLFSAMVGFRVRRSTNARTAEINERPATRDFKRLADA